MIKKFLVLIIFFSSLYANETTSYEKIVEEAITYNLGLKILEVEKEIAQSNIDEIESSYFPKIKLNFTTQYSRDLETSKGRVTKSSSSLYEDETKYISNGNLNIDWDIFDWEARDKKKEIAKIDKKLINYTKEEKIQDLKLKLLEEYTKVLNAKKQLSSYLKIKTISEEVYENKRRLYEAKQLDRLSLANEAINIIEQDKKILEIKALIEESLKEINFYAKSNYTVNTNFLPLKSNLDKEKLYEDSFISKSFKEKIKRKRMEIELLEAEQSSMVKFFYNYDYYDEGHFWKDSLHLRDKGYQFGFKLDINLFDGFREKALKKRLQAELKKLALEDRQEKENHQREKEKIKNELIVIDKNLKNSHKNITKSMFKTAMLKRLEKVKNIDSLSIKDNEIKSLQKVIDLDSHQIQKDLKEKQMQILGAKAPKIQKINIAKKDNSNRYIVIVNSVNVRAKPNLESKVLKNLMFKTEVNIEYCNEYKWCKLKDQQAYVAKFLISKL